MKKLLSILFAGMLLLSGMHMSMATHLCGGELAAVKWSFSGENASCGMENDNKARPVDYGFNSACCQNQMAFYTVDNNYNPSTFQINKPAYQLLQFLYVPESIGIQFLNTKFSAKTNVLPPGKFLTCAVSLPDICEFRI